MLERNGKVHNICWKTKPQSEPKMPEPPLAKECRICGGTDSLTKHHVKGGLLEHRKHNIFQSAWESLGLKTVTLCRHCHDRLHFMCSRKVDKPDVPEGKMEYLRYIRDKIKRRIDGKKD
jgi:hypothetical protein